MQALVHSADVQDRDGGVLLLSTLLGRFPYLEKLFADSAYQGPIFAAAVSKILSRVQVGIVKRSDQAKGFVVLPKRRIVERTIAWLNRCRRLAKDWENLNRTGLMFLRFASIRLMLRRFCNPVGTFESNSELSGDVTFARGLGMLELDVQLRLRLG